MQIIKHYLVKLVLLLTLAFLLTACSKVTQENFAKIKPNMTHNDVVAILGKPTSSDSISFAGFSGTSSTWKSKNAVIVIQFVNDQVMLKTYTTVGKNNNTN